MKNESYIIKLITNYADNDNREIVLGERNTLIEADDFRALCIEWLSNCPIQAFVDDSKIAVVDAETNKIVIESKFVRDKDAKVEW